MKVHFFDRKIIPTRISIEKLFIAVKKELVKLGCEVREFENPFPLQKMILTMCYFKKNQGQINHITGDIHWAALSLDPNRTVLTVHDMVGMRNLSGWKRELYFWLWFKLPLNRLKYIIVISEQTKSELLQYMPKIAHKITVIPNCLTVDIPAVLSPRDNVIPKILIVGTRENKNIDRIISALADIDCNVTFVGKLSVEQVNRLQTSKIIYQELVGLTDEELIVQYDIADILCFPTLYEGFGMPILEAQARGCAVLTSDISPMKEVAGRGGLLVNPESVDDIARGLKLLSSDKALRDSLQSLGVENAKKYLPENIAGLYKQYYLKMLKNDTPRCLVHQ